MALQLRHVSKRFTTGPAVSDLTLDVPRGSVFGLLGPNGAGKTTTLRLIMDIVRPDAGEIEWCGTPIADVPRRKLGYLPEERGLFADMGVADQISFFAQISGRSRRDAEAETERWLELTQISEHAAKPVSALSKGNQQKVQFLTALVHEPELLILDEPFSGLDPVNHALVERMLAQLSEAGTTLVLSTHDMEKVETLCDSVAMLHRSRLVFAGPVADLRARHGAQHHLRLVFSGDEAGLRRSIGSIEPIAHQDGRAHFSIRNGASADEVLRTAMKHGRVHELRDVEPGMRDIFMREIGADEDDEQEGHAHA